MKMKAVSQIIIVNILVYFLTFFLKTNNLYLNNLLAVYPISSGNFSLYQLFTHQFAHGSYTHIVSNLICLIFTGYDVEEEIGKKNFWKFYIFSGIFSSGLYCFSHQPIIGSSGSIFSVIMFCILLTWSKEKNNKTYIYWKIKFRNIFFLILIIIELWSAIFTTFDFVAHWAHVFGVIFAIFWYYSNRFAHP